MTDSFATFLGDHPAPWRVVACNDRTHWPPPPMCLHVTDGNAVSIATGVPRVLGAAFAALPELLVALNEAVATVSDVMAETLEHGHLEPRIERWGAALTAATGQPTEGGIS